MTRHEVWSAGSNLWRSITCPKSELRLDRTLACGQSFRWKETTKGHWTGVMGGHVWTLTQTDHTLWYHVYTHQDIKTEDQKGKRITLKQEDTGGAEKGVDIGVKEEAELLPLSASGSSREVQEEMLRDYFQLDVKLEDLYGQWGAADPHFKKVAETFTGVRMLRQDPTECLFSLICTSNNNISRIYGMVERLCQNLGTLLCQLDQTKYYDFPTLSALADPQVESRLRDLRFGYRAPYLQKSADQILKKLVPDWLQSLRSVPYERACEALQTLPGVGAKVANCVCLMALDKSEAIPIDTHVWQIAKRDYHFAAGKEKKTITKELHRGIGDFFRNLWGPYAGWAQAVLFCADLKQFQSHREPSSAQSEDEGQSTAECKPTKREQDETLTTPTTQPASRKKSKRSIKKEKDI